MARVRLSRAVSVTPTGSGVVLRSDLGTFQLEGSDTETFLTDILPLLDGSREPGDVAAALARYSPESVAGFLELLEERGLLEKVADAPHGENAPALSGQDEFFKLWNDVDGEFSHRLRSARVLVVGLEPWGLIAARELAGAGVARLHLLDSGYADSEDVTRLGLDARPRRGTLRAQAASDALTISAPACEVSWDLLHMEDNRTLRFGDQVWDLILVTAAVDDLLTLEAAARSAHQSGTSSLYGYMDGLDAVVGLAIPGQTACWNCTRLRLLANTANPEQMHALQASLLRAPPPRRTHTYPAPAPALLGNLLALEGLKLLSGYTPSTLAGKLLTQSIVSLETTLHTVIQMPWCEVCGGAAGRQVGGRGSPPEAGSNGAPDLDAIEDLTDLRQRLEGWIDDRTGVIPYASLAQPAPGEPELPFLATAVLASYTEGGYQPGQQQAGSGKGLTRPAALLGAVGEAVERYSAARYRREQLHRGLARQLDGEFIEPSALALYHPDQYANPAFPFPPLDPDRPVDWIRGRWLDSGDPVWLPALVALNDFRAPASEHFCQVTSNGLAAGRDLEDAYLRALLELVERDAFMVTWLCRRGATRLILDSSTDPLLLEVVRQLEACGASIELYLLGVGIDIPVVMCLGTGDGDNWPAVTVSLGCHPKPSIAVRRALLEQGQVGPHLRRLMRGAASPVPASPESVVSLTDHAMYYVPPDRLPILDFLRGASGSTTVADLNEPPDSSLQACLEKLSAAGLRVAGVDVTAPDVRLSPFRVARVVGPWLQPIDFGFNVRRLGNPRVLAMAPEGLNPHPHPLA